MDYPFYKGKLSKYITIVKDDKSFLAKLSFVIEKDKINNIKKYLDFRNKLDKLDLYFVDTDTGSRKRKQHKYIYIWTIVNNGNYEDYTNYLKSEFSYFSIK